MSSRLSKSSSVSEHSNNKATPKVVNRLSRASPKSDAPADPGSSLKNPRLSVDRSTRSSLNSKPTPVNRRSPKLTTPPDKQQTRVLKGSDLQAQLSLVKEDLKNAKEKLILIEKEKAQAIEGLKDAQRSTDEANEKLREAQVAQKQAEENSEIENFRVVEMEQAAIEATQKKEKEWKREIEAVRNQHALDIAELQKVKQKLSANLDRADDVTKIAEIHEKNMESLSAEVARLKGLLDSKFENETDDSTRLFSELEAKKEELEKAKGYEEKLAEKEARVEELNAELEAAKLAETSARRSVEEWRKMVKDLESQVDESIHLMSEIETLKQELEKAKGNEKKLAEKETYVEQLNAEMEAAKVAETSARKSLEEWKKKVKDLETQDGESTQLVSKLGLQIETLKQELEKGKSYKLKLVEKEACIEKLNLDLEAVELAETVARKSMEEWQKKVRDLEARDGESTLLVSELDLEIHTLKQELEKAKSYKQKLVEKEACIEKLNIELEAAELAESSARKSMEEWQKKVKVLEARAEESNRLERSASESLESVMKQLEKNNDLLHDAETEIGSLKEKVGILEFSITRQRGEIEESERELLVAKEKASEMTKKAESLRCELENVEEEKNQALNNEKLAAESVQSLLEEKNKIINELERFRNEEEKNNKEIRSLTTALGEASSQAKEANERLSSTQTEQENYENQIENLRLVLSATNEKYQNMLDEAKHEIDMLIDTIEQNKQGYQNSRTEWEQKEEDMMNSIKKSEDENSSIQREIIKLTDLLKEAEKEAGATNEFGARLKEAETEVLYLKEIIGEIKAESMSLKENLLNKENELQSVIEENDGFRKREASSIEKIEELTKLFDEAKTQKQEIIHVELSEREKDYELPAKVVECYEQNGHGKEDTKPKVELPPQQIEQPVEEDKKLEDGNLSDRDVNVVEVDVENLNGNQEDYEKKEKEEETKEVGVKMWEIIKISEQELSQVKQQEQECVEEEFDPKVDGDEKFDHVNGLSSAETVNNGGASPLMQHQKKKKPLLQKFGSLLKKKGTTNQK